MFIPGKDDALYHVSLALEPVDFGCNKNVTEYVPTTRKPRVFGYDIIKHMIKTRMPVSYAQNVKCKLNLEKDR